MKIAVSSSGPDLDAQLDPRFGRCPYFLIIDTADMRFEAVENENAALGGGAGIQAAQLVVSKSVQAVITGNCGPNAIKVLSAGGVQTYVEKSGTIKDILKKFKGDKLDSLTESNAPLHAGSGRMGMGRGKGMGHGKGMGRTMR